MAARQERRRNLSAAQILGLPSDYTLSDLLTRRHADLGATWTAKYAKSRALRRDFWLAELGKDVPLTAVNPAVVETIARKAQGSKSERWVQDVLRYLVDSFIYAEKKLKWIEPRHNLSAVTIPKARGTSKPYTLAEAQKLLPKLWEVHPVAGWCGAVAFQTGRRIGAIRTLEAEHVIRSDDWTFIRFPAETDKSRNRQEAAVYLLPERTDWTVPSDETCNGWIHDAETRAGVKHVSGRGWHGLKRLYATLADALPGADLQAATRRETLTKTYRQDVLAPKMDVARALLAHLSAS